MKDAPKIVLIILAHLFVGPENSRKVPTTFPAMNSTKTDRKKTQNELLQGGQGEEFLSAWPLCRLKVARKIRNSKRKQKRKMNVSKAPNCSDASL